MNKMKLVVKRYDLELLTKGIEIDFDDMNDSEFYEFKDYETVLNDDNLVVIATYSPIKDKFEEQAKNLKEQTEQAIWNSEALE